MSFPTHPDTLLPQLDGFTVQRVPAFRATKAYLCPDCGNDIAARQGHVVVWPDDHVDDRRHWHHHCWRFAVRRGRIA